MKVTTIAEGHEIIETPLHDFNLINPAELEMKPVNWLWPGWLPRGKLVLLGGNPGVGKTTLACSIVAIETSGGHWPFSMNRGHGGRVILLSAEDDPADTLTPRLVAAGADLNRIIIIDSLNRERDGRMVESFFSLSTDCHQLDGLLTSEPDVCLVVIDPLSAYLGARDSHRDADVREVLGPVSRLAALHGVCILGISHLSKDEGKSAINRFLGSTGIMAAARAALLAAQYEGRNVLVPAKMNLAEMGTAMEYEIQSCTVGEGIGTSRVSWVGQTDIHADEVMAAAKAQARAPSLLSCQQFLTDILQDGPKPAAFIENAAKDSGRSLRTLQRAKKILGVVSHKDAFSAGWRWYNKQQWANYEAVMNDEVGGLREGQECQNPQDTIFGGLGGKDTLQTPCKPNDNKGFKGTAEDSQETWQSSRGESERPAKAAKYGSLGNLAAKGENSAGN